jgi:choline kinase
MKIIILAAGKGERLLPLTKDTPKALLHLWDGTTILSRQIAAIKENPEIKDIVIVLGHHASKVEEKIPEYASDGITIKPIFNPVYDITNNLITLWIARHELEDDDFIITNGDNLFKPHVLKKLIHSTAEGIHITIDKKDKYAEEDMKVTIDKKKDRIIRVHKQIEPENTHGESVGIIKVQGKEHRKAFREALDALVKNLDYRDKFWLEVFNHLAEKNHYIGYVEISPDDWKEVDFHLDFTTIPFFIFDKGKFNEDFFKF